MLSTPPDLPRYLRADSEFYTWRLIEFCEAQRIIYTITADQSVGLMEEIAALPDKAWQRYGPKAQVSELLYAPINHAAHRYVVKRQQVTDVVPKRLCHLMPKRLCQ